MEKEKKSGKIFIIIDGYDYEDSKIICVFNSKELAIQHLKDWRKNRKKEFGTTEFVELPFGYKDGTHYRIAQEFVILTNNILK